MKIELIQGDITEQRVDAIVNAANSTLLGGGGRAIHVMFICFDEENYAIYRKMLDGETAG